MYTDAGVYTCSQGGRPYPIPGSYGPYQQDADTYAAWGLDSLKMYPWHLRLCIVMLIGSPLMRRDWCNTLINGTQLQPQIQYMVGLAGCMVAQALTVPMHSK